MVLCYDNGKELLFMIEKKKKVIILVLLGVMIFGFVGFCVSLIYENLKFSNGDDVGNGSTVHVNDKVNDGTNNQNNQPDSNVKTYRASGIIHVDTSKSTDHYKYKAYLLTLDNPITYENKSITEVQLISRINYIEGEKITCAEGEMVQSDESSFWVSNYGYYCYNSTLTAAQNVSDQQQIENIIDNQLYVLFNKTNMNDISNQERLNLAVWEYAKEKGINYFEVPSFTTSELENAYQQLSISNLSIKHEPIRGLLGNILDDQIYWNYDTSKNLYTKNDIDGHGVCVINAVKLIDENYQIKNGQYHVTIKSLFSHTCDADFYYDFYGNYNDASARLNPVVINSGTYPNDYSFIISYESKIIDTYERMRNQLDTYNYVFEKINNQFKLVNFYKN